MFQSLFDCCTVFIYVLVVLVVVSTPDGAALDAKKSRSAHGQVGENALQERRAAREKLTKEIIAATDKPLPNHHAPQCTPL